MEKAKIKGDESQWFYKAHFGMFIHFGLYSMYDDTEPGLYSNRDSRNRHESLAKKFNPSKFNADDWVSLAEDSGAKYICFTSKHGDGFCLWDTKLTDYKITNSPFKRDLLGELVDCCNYRKMPIMIYYSLRNEHHPISLYYRGITDKWLENNVGKPNWTEYIEFIKEQIKELCTNYGRIYGLFWDEADTMNNYHGKEINKIVKDLQPGAVVNDRNLSLGDYSTPERFIPVNIGKKRRFMECNDSISENRWGYSSDSVFHSTNLLIENLVQVSAMGGNYLLNVGPAPDGTIPKEYRERMFGIGRWLNKYGEAIFDTGECPVKVSESVGIMYGSALRQIGAATAKNNNIYLFLRKWPRIDRFIVPNIEGNPEKAILLPNREELGIERIPDGFMIKDVPAEPVESSVNVIKFVFKKPPKIYESVEPVKKVVEIPDCQTITLSAENAELENTKTGICLHHVKKLADGSKDVGFLSEATCDINWYVRNEKEREFEVYIETGCPAEKAGSEFLINIGGKRLKGIVKPTNGWEDFIRYKLGNATLTEGKHKITFKILNIKDTSFGASFGDVNSLILIPKNECNYGKDRS